MKKHVVNVALLVAVVAVVVVSLVVGAHRSSQPDGEKFGGTDSVVTEQLSAAGHEPWFTPLFTPGSSEVESGLFAMQAALGAGVLGYCFGALHSRRRMRRDGAVVATEGTTGAGVSPAVSSAGDVPDATNHDPQRLEGH